MGLCPTPRQPFEKGWAKTFLAWVCTSITSFCFLRACAKKSLAQAVIADKESSLSFLRCGLALTENLLGDFLSQNDTTFLQTNANKVFEGFLGELFSKSSPKRFSNKSKFNNKKGTFKSPLLFHLTIGLKELLLKMSVL